MLLRLVASSASAALLTYFTRSSRPNSTTAVASQSKSGRTGELMRRGRRARPYLPEAAELAAKLLDILRVQVDLVLKRLQSLLHSRVVALVAVANALLLDELLLSVGEQLLFVLQLRFENPAAVFVAVRRD